MTLPATRSGAKNFLGDMEVNGFPIHPLEADLTITVGVGGEPETINGCLAKYSRMYPAYVVGGAVFTLHLPAGFTMAEQVLVNAIDLSHWQITGADAETAITRSALTTEFEGRYPAFGATNGGRLPLIAQLFDMDTSGTADNRDGVSVRDAGSVANIASACGVKNAGASGLLVAVSASANADDSIFSGAGAFGAILATRVSCISANGANARKGESDSTQDFRVVFASIINATDGTGGVSQTANTWTEHGFIGK